jgi:predicted TIM-barrel fold metal-dependent hydrolase
MGNLRPEKPDFRQHLERLAADAIFRGLRVPQDSVLENLDGTDFRRGIALLAEKDLTLDLNGGPKLHAAAVTLSAAYPSLRIVIDHVGISGDPTRLSDEWRASMRALGKSPNIFCKVSALMEQTLPAGQTWNGAPRDTAYYLPVLDHCWECFGPQRVVYASNWPVCEKGGTYADQFRIVNEYFTAKGIEACEDFFWRNSRTAYRWKERV